MPILITPFSQMWPGCLFKPHPCSSCRFHLKAKEKTDQQLPCERERDAELFFMGSVGARKVLRCPLPPSEASWAPLTPWERGNDFQSLVRQERTASQHLEGIMLLLPEGETQGVSDGGVTVCVWTKLCLIYTEWLNYIVFWELGYKTMTSWEVLSWMRVANRDDGR